MSQISSINFQKSKDFQVFHNSTVRPSYAIGGGLEYTLKGYAARSLKEKLIAEAKKTYENTIKQPFKAKSYEWSAVVNLKPDSTMQDLERLAKHFNDKYGFQCYQIAIHRDEGHISDTGEKIINHHAHLEFITLDKNTGKNNYRRELITPSVLRQIQSETAQILGMERGIDKRLSGVERIEPRKYAKMKEAERTKIRELKAKALRVSQEQESEILALRAENEVSNINFNTQKLDFEQTIRELSNEHSVLQDKFWETKEENFLLKNQNSDLNAQICILSNEKKKIYLDLTQELKTRENAFNELKNTKDKEIALELAEKTRKHFKGKGLTQIFFKELSEIKKEVKVNKNAVLSEIKRKIHNLIKNHSNDYKAWFRSKIQQNQALQDREKSLEQEKLKILDLALEKQDLQKQLFEAKKEILLLKNAQICILSNEKEKKDTNPYLEQENRLEATLEQKNDAKLQEEYAEMIKNFHKKK